MTANRIINHIFHQPDLQHVDQAELERLVAQYPYFAAARLLLAQKKFAAEHNMADATMKNAQLYSGTPHHLHQFLRENDMSAAPATAPEAVQENRDAVQLASQYYGLNSIPTLTETPAAAEPIVYTEADVEDQSAQYQAAYYGGASTHEEEAAAENDIYNTVIDEPGETIADSSNIENDAENMAAARYEQFVEEKPPVAVITDLAEMEDNALATIASATAIEEDATDKFNTLAEAEENALATVDAAEASEVEAIEQFNTLAEAEENAVATVEAAEAVEVEAIEQFNTLAEAEENAVATVEAAEAVEVEAIEQFNTLAEAEENAVATVEAAEAVEVEAIEQFNTLAEAEENAVATVEAAEAVEVEAIEQFSTLAEAEENAVATVEAAEAVEVEAIEQFNTLAEAEENAVATVEAAEAVEIAATEQFNTLPEAAATEATEQLSTATEEPTPFFHEEPLSEAPPAFYNTTLDEPGETIEDTSNTEALIEAAAAEQFNNIVDGEPVPETAIYNTTLDQPGETIEDTSNTEALMEAAAAEEFSEIVAAEDEGPIKIFPLDIPAKEEDTLIYQPLYTDDYFAYKRIKEPERADHISDKGEAEMKSFTDWLRQMKDSFSSKSQRDWYHQQLHRLYEDEEPEVSEAVEKMAIESITFNDDIVSETLAEIWVRQHQYQKAISIYQKLSLLNPGKNAYFAQKIKDLQLQTDNNK